MSQGCEENQALNALIVIQGEIQTSEIHGGKRHGSTRMALSLRLSLPRVRVCNQLIRGISTLENSQTAASERRTTSFGFRTVPEEAKETLVKNVFDSVASSYDLMNDATSFGVHRLWKDTFVSSLNPGRKGPMRCLDVAGGTGDIALRILDHARERYADRETSVDVVDINGQMLKEGFKRFKKTMYHNSKSTSTFTCLTFSSLFSTPDLIPRGQRPSTPRSTV